MIDGSCFAPEAFGSQAWHGGRADKSWAWPSICSDGDKLQSFGSSADTQPFAKPILKRETTAGPNLADNPFDEPIFIREVWIEVAYQRDAERQLSENWKHTISIRMRASLAERQLCRAYRIAAAYPAIRTFKYFRLSGRHKVTSGRCRRRSKMVDRIVQAPLRQLPTRVVKELLPKMP